MKFKGTPNLLVRVSRPRRGEVKLFYFDENGFYETDHPFTAQRLRATFEEVIEEEPIKKPEIEESEQTEKELRAKAKEAGIKSWHLKKPENLKRELEEINASDSN